MGVIEGSILFENGKIVRVSKYISPPDNCVVIDLSGKHVYPGMIAAVSGIGLIEINAVSSQMITLNVEILIQCKNQRSLQP